MKSTPRFYIDKTQIKRKRFLLQDERVVRHMGLVLRLKKGDEIILFDGEGGEYEATLGYLDKTQAAGVILSESRIESSVGYNITLAQSLPRAGKLDDIVRMNTEVGVQEFILFESEYSVAKAESMTDKKILRLHKVAVEALRQSEGNIVPKISGPILIKELLSSTVYDHKILLHSRNSKNSKNIVEIRPSLTIDQKVLVIIGPEGGFSAKEIKLAQESGCQISYMDLPILRTETAGVVVCSYLLLK